MTSQQHKIFSNIYLKRCRCNDRHCNDSITVKGNKYRLTKYGHLLVRNLTQNDAAFYRYGDIPCRVVIATLPRI